MHSASQVWAEVGRSDGLSDPKKSRRAACGGSVGREFPTPIFFAAALHAAGRSVGGVRLPFTSPRHAAGRSVGRCTAVFFLSRRRAPNTTPTGLRRPIRVSNNRAQHITYCTDILSGEEKLRHLLFALWVDWQPSSPGPRGTVSLASRLLRDAHWEYAKGAATLVGQRVLGRQGVS